MIFKSPYPSGTCHWSSLQRRPDHNHNDHGVYNYDHDDHYVLNDDHYHHDVLNDDHDHHDVLNYDHYHHDVYNDDHYHNDVYNDDHFIANQDDEPAPPRPKPCEHCRPSLTEKIVIGDKVDD